MKISKILVANRGEIALRVFKTCREMNIKTVSIYSEEDKGLPHSFTADENIYIGAGALSETYLNIEKIISLCKDLNVDAIHPGYGFLSENPIFAQRLAEEKIIFIGPSVHAINIMGDKKTSKDEMQRIGIPLIPGYHGSEQDAKFLQKEANKIGFPVLVKATAGGGGKGMKIVQSESEFLAALESAKREAKNAFGNDKVLLEKYIENPRHIEVQLVSDGQGNHFHFYDRECSIQRRYQKVIEESPSPALDGELRDQMCQTAVQIAKGIDYIGAGTIEFILSADKSYYFLEMNTRLQVEHPITEMVTKTDLVSLQIKAAQGEAFPFTQSDITQTGHSFECRIYAEDPDNDFLPTNGQIQQIGKTTARLDCGYADGDMVSTSFDPMLAKLITYAADRSTARSAMLKELDTVVFGGVKTNRDFMKRVLRHPDFIQGEYHTHFLKQYSDDLAPRDFSVLEKGKLISAFLFTHLKQDKFLGFSLSNETQSSFIIINKQEVEFRVLGYDGTQLQLSIDETKLAFIEDNLTIQSYVVKDSYHQLFVDGLEGIVSCPFRAKRFTGEQLRAGSLQSPMPGKIFKILKQEGEPVQTGETILILEAMKMEHAIKANVTGKVEKIFFRPGDQVAGQSLLCEINEA